MTTKLTEEQIAEFEKLVERESMQWKVTPVIVQNIKYLLAERTEMIEELKSLQVVHAECMRLAVKLADAVRDCQTEVAFDVQDALVDFINSRQPSAESTKEKK